MLRKGLDAFEAVFVDDDNFTRLNVAHQFGVDQIQRAGFTGQHPGAIDFPNAQGTKPMGIAHADQFLLGHDDQRISAFNLAHGLNEVVLRLSQQVQNNFAIDGGLKDQSIRFELVAQFCRVGQITVVRNGHVAFGAIDRQRLGVAQMGRAGGRIAGVADGDVADQAMQDFAVEDLRHQPHAFVFAQVIAVRRDDAGALLPTML